MAQVVSRELIDRKADIAVAAMTINFARYEYPDIIRAANEPLEKFSLSRKMLLLRALS